MYKDIISLSKEIGFSDVSFVKIPLLYVSSTAIKYPFFKFLALFLKPLMSIDFLKDYLSQRLVFILKNKINGWFVSTTFIAFDIHIEIRA